MKNVGKLFFRTALLLLIAGLILGCFAAASYVWPGFLKSQLGFMAMRPLHVSAVLFWILIGASASVYFGLNQLKPNELKSSLAYTQYALWLIAIVGMFYSYAVGDFGGREYWEFNPIWALPITLAWIIFIIQFLRITLQIKGWPVYMWMWLTGLVFFLFTFLEGYLWTIPYFRNALITDMTIQWKVNGSMVGAWNQIIYGTAMFLMDKISGKENTGKSKLAFAMYFLGFFNLCFNWGHHIYTLPALPYIRQIGYAVSMTEWIFFLRIVWNWKNDLNEIRNHYSYFPYRFLMASNFWVLLNLVLALFMSIPAFNLYSHGTHTTVAHAMGTTIGINTMILMAAAFMFLSSGPSIQSKENKAVNGMFWILQISLLLFWLSLIGSGIHKGLWQMEHTKIPFAEMFEQLKPWFILFFLAGLAITLSLGGLAIHLLGNKRKNTL